MKYTKRTCTFAKPKILASLASFSHGWRPLGEEEHELVILFLQKITKCLELCKFSWSLWTLPTQLFTLLSFSLPPFPSLPSFLRQPPSFSLSSPPFLCSWKKLALHRATREAKKRVQGSHLCHHKVIMLIIRLLCHCLLSLSFSLSFRLPLFLTTTLTWPSSSLFLYLLSFCPSLSLSSFTRASLYTHSRGTMSQIVQDRSLVVRCANFCPLWFIIGQGVLERQRKLFTHLDADTKNTI